MMTRTVSRAVAVALALVLVAMAPGVPAWAAVAGTVARPTPYRAGLGIGVGSVPVGAPLAGGLTLNVPSLPASFSALQPYNSIQWSAAKTAYSLSPVHIEPTVVGNAVPGSLGSPMNKAALPSLVSLAQDPTETKPMAPDVISNRSGLFDGSVDQNRFQGEPGGIPSSPEPSAPRPTLKPVASKGSDHAPFVAEASVVASMEKLVASDPVAALAAASTALLDEGKSAPVVKIGAMRVLVALEKTMPTETMSVYLAILSLGARADIQSAKERGSDPWWYFQREASKRIAHAASSRAFVPGHAMAALTVAKLTAANKDQNASVRLAAGEALRALGMEPAPEEIAKPAVEPSSVIAQGEKAQAAKGVLGRLSLRVKVGLAAIALVSVIGGMEGYFSHVRASQPVLDLPAIMTSIENKTYNQPVSAPVAQAAPPAAPVQSSEVQAANVLSAQQRVQQGSLDEINLNLKGMADANASLVKAVQDAAKPQSFLSSLLGPLITTVVGVVLFVFLLTKMGGMGGRNSPKTKPVMGKDKPTTRFSDIAGMDESLIEIHEILDFLRNPERFKRLGARMPKGVLMEGPPGTGKTLLAKALAGEANANFISISGSDFVEMYVGLGAARVRSLFEEARKSAPAIIFIDEIDAVGKSRGNGQSGGGNDEREQTINALLKEMDGFGNQGGVIVIAATNRADTLDPALTRPGRFDRKIHVGLPEAAGREAILTLHARQARLAAEVDLSLIARRTSGMSGAFLQNVVNEAALLAARGGADAIGAAHIDEAVDRAGIGAKRTMPLTDEEKRSIALHEAGHVLADLLNERPELRVAVNKVTILPHGSGALGFAEIAYGDKHLHKRAELEARLDTALGGLVAEKIFNGEWSSGPGSDLQTATRIARAMVEELGMSDEMGLANTSPNQGDPLQRGAFGDAISAKVHAEVNRLLDEALKRTEKRLRANKDKHEAMIEALLRKETLSADEINAIAHPEPSRTQP